MKMRREHDPEDPAQVFVHRAVTALYEEFRGDDQVPRFVIVVEMPPAGRVAIAATTDDDVDTHRVLSLGAGSVRSSMSEHDKERAREMWAAMGDVLNRRN